MNATVAIVHYQLPKSLGEHYIAVEYDGSSFYTYNDVEGATQKHPENSLDYLMSVYRRTVKNVLIINR